MQIKSNIADEFDEFSRNYTEDMVGCVPNYNILIENFILDFESYFTPSSILDLGSGNGNVVRKLLHKFPKATYTLVDASQDMLDLCQSYFEAYSMAYVNTYFNDFEFKTNNYDLVTAGFSLHHSLSKDKPEIYARIFEALKPGGVFACSDLMIDKSHNAHSTHLNTWKQFVSKTFPDGKKWEWLMQHYDEFDHPESISNHLHMLDHAGFKKVTCCVYENYWSHFKAYKN